MDRLAIDQTQFTIISFTRDVYEPVIPAVLVMFLPPSISPYQCNVIPHNSLSSIDCQSKPLPISVMQDGVIEGKRMMESLASHGHARLRLTDKAMLEVIQTAKKLTPSIFECTREKKLYRKRLAITGGGPWGEGGAGSKRRPFVGYSPDTHGREFYQVRRYDGVLPWPEARDEGLSEQENLHVYARLFDMMESISIEALKAICDELQLDKSKVIGLLDLPHDLPWVQGKCRGKLPLGVRAVRNMRTFAKKRGWDWINRILPPPPPLKRSGASVLRIYKYFKEKDLPPSPPATGLHCDMGLITVALKSAVPGLMIFNSNKGVMMDVERVQPGQEEGVDDELIVFAGEALGLITAGRVKAPVHFVDESFIGQPRFSFPFFLRPRPDADLSPLIDLSVRQEDGPFTYGMFIERVMWKDRPWSPKPGSSNSPLGSDY